MLLRFGRSSALLLGLALYTGCNPTPQADPNYVMRVDAGLKPVEWTQQKIDAETRQVMEDLKTMERALTTGDAGLMMPMVPQSLIDHLGGDVKAKQTLQAQYDGLLADGLKFSGWIPGTPKFLRSANYEFVLITTNAEMSVGGKTGVSSTVQLGSRKMGETKWRYIDAGRMRRAKQDLIAEFPADYPIPDPKVELKK